MPASSWPYYVNVSGENLSLHIEGIVEANYSLNIGCYPEKGSNLFESKITGSIKTGERKKIDLHLQKCSE